MPIDDIIPGNEKKKSVNPHGSPNRFNNRPGGRDAAGRSEGGVPYT